MAFDPDQPRDELGRWTDEGGGSSSKFPGLSPREIAALKPLPTLVHGSENAASAIQMAASDQPNKEDQIGYRRLSSFTPNPNLDDAQKVVEERFINDLQENYFLRKGEYLANSDLSGPHHNIIGNDNIKDLSPDYNKNLETRAEFAPAVHEPASAFAKALYSDLLKRTPRSNDVVFTAGGTGAGKTTGINNIEEYKMMANKADIVYDSNLAGYGSAKSKIDEALRTGREVNILYVHRDIEDAFKEGVIPRMKRQGRVVPITEHVVRTVDALKTAEKLQDTYRNTNRVQFRYIDNSLGWGNTRKATFDDIKNKVYLYDTNKAIKDLTDYVTNEFRQGRITEKQFKGLTTKTE